MRDAGGIFEVIGFLCIHQVDHVKVTCPSEFGFGSHKFSLFYHRWKERLRRLWQGIPSSSEWISNPVELEDVGYAINERVRNSAPNEKQFLV